MNEQFDFDRAQAQSKVERRKSRFKNAAAIVALSAFIIASEYAIETTAPEISQPPCSQLFSIEACNSFPPSTATPIRIPDRQMTPPTTDDRRR